MAATSPFVILVDWMGWREAFRVIAVVTLLLVLLFYVVVRDRPEVFTRTGRSNSPGFPTIGDLGCC
jgi:predicted MFS family arabinose efflux permease